MSIILSALISEKSMNDVSKGRFTFKVTTAANKASIKQEIEKRFNVNVVKISTINTKGRSARTGIRRIETVKQPFKKAIVTLKTGQKISLFESGASK